MNTLNEKLKAKFEEAVENYTDLLIKRIEAASKDLNAESVVKADEAVRMAVYIATALEKLDRPNCSNKTDGLSN